MQATLTLPVELAKLPASTLQWIIAKTSQRGQTPEKIALDALVKAAEKDGFKVKKEVVR